MNEVDWLGRMKGIIRKGVKTGYSGMKETKLYMDANILMKLVYANRNPLQYTPSPGRQAMATQPSSRCTSAAESHHMGRLMLSVGWCPQSVFKCGGLGSV